ncbi:MAG: protein jag [Clostridiales bacterium]|nr:protein jag [Clostridiales bacterium]
MAKSIERTGKTVEEAIEVALKELNVTEENVNIEVLEEPAKGLLGIGAKPALVKVTLKDNKNGIINEFLTKVAGCMNITLTNKIEEKDGRISVNMEGNDMGLLIGYRGETLEALQTILGVVANKGSEDYVRIDLDAENYREKRKETLKNLASKKAYEAVKYNKNITLEPMNAYERRIIHMALQENDKVTTYSIGEEPYRKIVIKKA